MAEFRVVAERDVPPHAVIDIWFVTPTCGPSRVYGASAVLIGNYLFDYETGAMVSKVTASLSKVLHGSRPKRIW